MYTRNKAPIHHWLSPHSEATNEDLIYGLEIWFERHLAEHLHDASRHTRQDLREDYLHIVQAALKQIYLRGVADGMDTDPTQLAHSESQAPADDTP